MPKVTVLMPLFNGIDFIEESLQSVQAQTFTDWEFIIVNDGCQDGSDEVVRTYAQKDPRIILLDPGKHQGVAGALNYGLQFAKGQYIARVDDDDPSRPNRFEREVEYLDQHPEITLVSCWQRTVTPQKQTVLKVACDPDQLKADMLFGCEISHCGVMFRLADMNAHGWRYNTSYLGEDYELWTRMQMEGARMANLPESLVDHRIGFGNVTLALGDVFRAESARLSQRNVQQLGIDTSRYPSELFMSWRHQPSAYAKANPARFLADGAALIQEIARENKRKNCFNQTALEKTLYRRWNWVRQCCGLSFRNYPLDRFQSAETTPLVSVVLPLFNSVSNISGTIDSILDQTVTDWELLAVSDDACNDGTAEIVQMYAAFDKRIHLIPAHAHIEPTDSLDSYIHSAKGKYIARLSADTLSKPKSFEEQLTYFDAHPEIETHDSWQRRSTSKNESGHKPLGKIERKENSPVTPKVTVLMPLFNGMDFIEESLQSIQAQTFTDWEFIIVNDFGSDDGCADVIRAYAEKDPRIILIQAGERLGLAASLNFGLEYARGEYIARVDADDPSYPNRLERQVAYMDEHPEITLISSWQRAVTVNSESVQEVACDPDELRTDMLFGCEISHCGVMFRMADMNAHGWRYDPSFLSEDYELWTRMQMEGAKMANLPEILVNHRWGFGNISIAKGNRLHREGSMLSQRNIQQLGFDTSSYPAELFMGWRSKPTTFARKNTARFLKDGASLLLRILRENRKKQIFNQTALEKTVYKRWNWIRECCGLKFNQYTFDQFQGIETTPVVSVVLPTFNSASDLSRSIDSVLDQTFTDWELLVINDFMSSDGTAEIVQMYSAFDKRIHLIQAEERLGLAESLNVGIRAANGRYIARLDADDTAVPERFEKQVRYLDAHEDVGVCGSWQLHYGKNTKWVHKAPENPATCRTRFLFWCDLCHSTLMLRKASFVENELYYDPDYNAEDFELWTRAMQYMQFANIPEVLGDYKESGSSITDQKKQALHKESGIIVANTLKRLWQVELSQEDTALFNSWQNDYPKSKNREEQLNRLEYLLRMIWDKNQEVPFFDNAELLQTLASKWYWAKDNSSWRDVHYNVSKIEDVFSGKAKQLTLQDKYQNFRQEHPTVPQMVKGIFLTPIANLLRRIIHNLFRDVIFDISHSVEGWTWDRYIRTNKDIEHWTWNRYTRTNKDIERWTWKRYQSSELFLRNEMRMLDTSANEHHFLVPYLTGTKIRTVFLFQIASFWPSLESLYEEMMADSRYDVRLVCYDEDVDPSVKTETAREYLVRNNYDFIDWKDFNITDFSPHIVFVQTPYDGNRREEYRMTTLMHNGYRPILISYGIEIGNTLHARYDNFIRKCNSTWRVYTLSPRMREDYLYYTRNLQQIQALGLPKFDSLYHREKYPQYQEVLNQAKGRKVVLWKVHFPKMINENGKKIMVTPDISEYIQFAEQIEKHDDLFFVFMPHPRFVEFNDDETVRMQAEHLVSILREKANVYIDMADDYRPSLLNAEAIIIDRSSVMVEAGIVGVPVLFMSNPDYYEPMPGGISPLVDSYEQGQSCQDMLEFIDRCRAGIDLKKAEREAALVECIPGFDGNCSRRIADEIACSLNQEANTLTIEERLDRIEKLLLEQKN